MTITGTNLTGATSVELRVHCRDELHGEQRHQITATPPPGSAGTVDVTVTTPGGTSATSAADQYTYIAPAEPASPPPGSSLFSAGGRGWVADD